MSGFGFTDTFGGGGFGGSSSSTFGSFGTPAPASDPFGFGAPSPAPAPAGGGWGASSTTDPFGVGGFGTPAPASGGGFSAPASSDPFGGGGFGASPAPTSDPFGFGTPAPSASSGWGAPAPWGTPAPAPGSGDPFGFGAGGGVSAAQMNPQNRHDHRLKKDPADGVTQLNFHPTKTKFLLASTWGCKALLYDCSKSENYCAVYEHKAPVLCSGFQNASVCITGDCAGLLRMWDLKTKQTKVFGKHKQPIRCLKWQKDLNCCMTGSWDNTVAFWDPRQSTGRPSVTFDLGGSVHCFDSVGCRVVVSSKSEQMKGGSVIKSFDWRKQSHIATEQQKDWIKFQHRTIACFKLPRPGYAVGTIGGKVGIRYFNPDKKRKDLQNFVFRCHQQPAGKTFAVNDIKFNKHGTFATVGADGTYSVWDKGARTVSIKSQACKDAIACCAWDNDLQNQNQNFFAYAVSYEWSQGPRSQTNANCIYYRQVQYKDVKSKNRHGR